METVESLILPVATVIISPVNSKSTGISIIWQKKTYNSVVSTREYSLEKKSPEMEMEAKVTCPIGNCRVAFQEQKKLAH